MKIIMGDLSRTYGTVEDTPDGLRYSGDTAQLTGIVGYFRRQRPRLSDVDLLASLPHRLRSPYCWARLEPPHGNG